MFSPRSRALLGLSASFLVFLALNLDSIQLFTRIESDQVRRMNVRRSLRELNAILIEVLTAEISLRGFAASGGPAFLARYQRSWSSIGELETRLPAIMETISGAPELKSLESELLDWRRRMHESSINGSPTARPIAGTVPSAVETQESILRIRSTILGTIDSELAKFAREEALLASESSQLRTILKLSCLGGFVLVVTTAVLLMRVYRKRERWEEAIQALNRSLLLRQEELENVNRALASFSFSVSHDLRAPLRALDGFSAELLEDLPSDFPERARDRLGRIRKASQRMNRMIDSLLLLSRFSSQPLRPEPIDLTTMAREVALELAQADPSRRCDLTVQEGLATSGDPELVRLLLGNLIGNSWKYTGKRQMAKIEVGSAERNGKPVFFVRDNGTGFSFVEPSRLFGAFQRLHSDSEFPGDGVGLAIVERIVHRHGGSVEGEGRPDAGAVFYFNLGADRDGIQHS